MTSIDLPLAATDATATAADQGVAAVAERRLRLVLRANAATSFAAGAAALAAPGRVADLLGIAGTGWPRLVGAALVLFALDVLWVSTARRADRLRTGAAVVSAFDAAWVVATVALVAAGAFDGVGTAVAVAMGVGVLGFGLLQLHLRRRMG
jgi:hypothetical protein